MGEGSRGETQVAATRRVEEILGSRRLVQRYPDPLQHYRRPTGPRHQVLISDPPTFRNDFSPVNYFVACPRVVLYVHGGIVV